jgi:pyrroline-5-carboxylate reductase
MRIGIIGIGHIATDVLRGLLASGFDPAKLLMGPRGHGVSALAFRGIAVAPCSAAVVERCDLVLLAVRPDQALKAVTDLPWQQHHTLVSLCAGVPITTFRRVVREANIVRAIPLGAAAQGGSPTIIFPDHSAVRTLFGHVGSVTTLVREEDFGPATVAGVLYTLAHDLVGLTAEWAVAEGIPPEAARRLATAQLKAAATMLAADEVTPVADMVRALATPGGIAETAFGSLDRDAFGVRWRAALDAGLQRIRDIEAAHRT